MRQDSGHNGTRPALPEAPTRGVTLIRIAAPGDGRRPDGSGNGCE